LESENGGRGGQGLGRGARERSGPDHIRAEPFGTDGELVGSCCSGFCHDSSAQQQRFNQMSTTIIGRIDEMGTRIDDLEKSIADLMQQVISIRLGHSKFSFLY
jgi:hypothetical protein